MIVFFQMLTTIAMSGVIVNCAEYAAFSWDGSSNCHLIAAVPDERVVDDKGYSELVDKMKSRDPNVRLDAVTRLSSWSENPEAVTLLVDALKDDNEYVVHEASREICTLSAPPIDAVIKLLNEHFERPCLHYYEPFFVVIYSLGPDGKKVIPSMLRAIESKDEGIRPYAVRALGRMRAAAVECVPKSLILLREDKSSSVRSEAALACAKIAPEKKEVLDGLVSTLNASSTSVKTSAIESLGILGSRAVEAVPALKEILFETDGTVSRSAARALGEIGFGAKEAVPALIAVLASKDNELRRHSVTSLGKIGSGNEHVVHALVGAMSDGSWSIRVASAEALGNLGVQSHGAIERLKKSLEDEEPYVQIAAATAIWKITKETQIAMPVLRTRLQKLDAAKMENESSLSLEEQMFDMVVDAVRIIGPDAQILVPFFVDLLSSRNSRVRHDACVALGHIGNNSKVAIPHLRYLEKDRNPRVRQAATAALGIIGEK